MYINFLSWKIIIDPIFQTLIVQLQSNDEKEFTGEYVRKNFSSLPEVTILNNQTNEAILKGLIEGLQRGQQKITMIKFAEDFDKIIANGPDGYNTGNFYFGCSSI